MRKINLLFILLGVFAVSFLTSCDPEGSTEDIQPLLTLTPAGLGTDNVVTGTDFSVTVKSDENPSSKKKIKDLLITSTSGVDTTISIGSSTDTRLLTFGAPAAGTTVTYTFRIEDNAGESNTKTLAVKGETVVVATPFGTEVSGAFFHIQGASQGAYDLVSETTVASAGAETSKDMKNTDAAAATFTGSWTTGSGNGTTFVSANSFDYDNGSVEEAEAAFTSGTASGTVTNPSNGDVFIAKLRGGSDYAIIEIVSVDPTNNECNCANTGKVTFNFKKS